MMLDSKADLSGTGKTMLVKAVANATSASFIRVVGSEFVQKYLGEVSSSRPKRLCDLADSSRDPVWSEMSSDWLARTLPVSFS